VIVAAHDEAARIGATLAALERAFPGARLWVADDGSRDGTAAIARAAGALVVGSGRVVGKGGAMTAAARAALERSRAERRPEVARAPTVADQRAAAPGAIYVLCDGDLADSAGELAPLADAVRGGEADVAVAVFARRVGGGIGLALAFARWAIRSGCGVQTRAPISGQRALAEHALEHVLPFAHGYGMELGMTIDAVRAGDRLIEIELDLAHRASGRSLAGFAHRARQLIDFARAYARRRAR